jgi:hypothetical protein
VERHEIPRTRVIAELLIDGRLKNRPNKGVDVSCILDRRQFYDAILLAVDADVLNLFRDIEDVATNASSRIRVSLKRCEPAILACRQTKALFVGFDGVEGCARIEERGIAILGAVRRVEDTPLHPAVHRSHHRSKLIRLQRTADRRWRHVFDPVQTNKVDPVDKAASTGDRTRASR